MSKKAARTVSTKVDLKNLLNPSEMSKKLKNKTPKKIKDKRKQGGDAPHFSINRGGINGNKDS